MLPLLTTIVRECPWAEIVTDPDMHTAQEAFFFLKALRNIVVFSKLSDCDMEKGQLRCDANVSVRPKGASFLNPKVEIKNLNSISSVRNAIEYEIKRQTQLYQKGEIALQETRRWDLESSRTSSMRSKENAEDYRYFPDPDLPHLYLSPYDVESLRAALPEKPLKRQQRYQKIYGIPYATASVICTSPFLSAYFEQALKGEFVS